MGQVFNAYHVTTAANHAQILPNVQPAIIQNLGCLTQPLDIALVKLDSMIMGFHNSFA
jgi:hypothetical protein